MPAVLITIIGPVLSSLLFRVLAGGMLAILSYNWVNDLVAQAQDRMYGLLNNIPAAMFGAISILQVPQALSIVMSAIGIATFIRTAKVVIGKAQ